MQTAQEIAAEKLEKVKFRFLSWIQGDDGEPGTCAVYGRRVGPRTTYAQIEPNGMIFGSQTVEEFLADIE